MKDLRVLIFNFAKSHDYLNLIDPKPDDVGGYCCEVSEDLIKYLSKHDIDCKNIIGIEWNLPFEKDCDIQIKIGYSYFHEAVLVDDLVIDLTSIQFGEKYKEQFYPKEEFYKRFKNVYIDLDDNELEKAIEEG